MASSRSQKNAAYTWKLPTVDVRQSIPAVDTEVVPVFQGENRKIIVPADSRYSELLAKLGKGEAFQARHGSVQMVRFGGVGSAQSVLFLGMGKVSELTAERVRQASGTLWGKLAAEKVESVALSVEGALAQTPNARAFLEGMLLNAYSFTKYKKGSENSSGGLTKVFLVSSDRTVASHLTEESRRALAVAEAVNITRDWSNEPSNFGTPEYFASESMRHARRLGIKCRVLSESDAKREGMGLFLAVGQGSVREGKIVVMEYLPKGKTAKNAKTIAFVGKGITFDSGGISIKPSMRMEDMKHDMTGAATLFGATLLAAMLKVPNRVVTILAFTENMPDGGAIQPGNVVRSRNGKTVEIINTDAEGRLILADVLDYAHEFKPDVIVDAATLTGAVSVALGKHCCAILGNDDGLIEALRASGTENHERIWQLPMFDEYFEDLKSDTADMKNSANDGAGGTIRGAIFMAQFIRKGMKWAHLDIAATAYGMGHVSYYPKKGASGIYVRTLAQFAAEF